MVLTYCYIRAGAPRAHGRAAGTKLYTRTVITRNGIYMYLMINAQWP